MLTVIVISAITLKFLGYGVVYQVTPSMPEGFYWRMPPKHLHRNDIVIFYPPSSILLFMHQHHLVPKDGWVMKYILGVPGDFVCKKQGYVWINQYKIARVQQYYQPGRKLPNTPFCRRLGTQEYLLMSTKVVHSFDGRYFGPVKKQHIIGEMIPLNRGKGLL